MKRDKNLLLKYNPDLVKQRQEEREKDERILRKSINQRRAGAY
jgi:hypothetical protein